MRLQSPHFIEDYSDIFMKFGDKPCSRFKRIIHLNEPSCNETCFSISVGGCYGNNFISLLSAIAVARGVGIKRIVVKNNFLFFKKNFTYRDISIEINSDRSKCYHWHFFYWPDEMKPLISKFVPRIYPELHKALLENIPKIKIPDDALVMHFRSGDAFKPVKPHRKYGQPPCNYYLDVLRMKNWSKVFILSQDDKNPCVNIVAREVGSYKPQKLIDDLSYMMSAKNLVISTSTFVNSIATISEKIENLFSFNHFRFIDINSMNCIPTDEYKKEVINYWKNNEKQRKMVIESKSCKKWEKLPKLIDYRIINENFWALH